MVYIVSMVWRMDGEFGIKYVQYKAMYITVHNDIVYEQIIRTHLNIQIKNIHCSIQYRMSLLLEYRNLTPVTLLVLPVCWYLRATPTNQLASGLRAVGWFAEPHAEHSPPSDGTSWTCHICSVIWLWPACPVKVWAFSRSSRTGALVTRTPFSLALFSMGSISSL